MGIFIVRFSAPGFTPAITDPITISAGGGGAVANPSLLPLAKTGATGTPPIVVPGLAAQPAGYTYADPVSGVPVVKVTSSTVPDAGSHGGCYATGGPHCSLPWVGGDGHVYYTLRHLDGDGGGDYLVDIRYDLVGVSNPFSNRRLGPGAGEVDAFWSCNPATPRILYYKSGDKQVSRYDTATNSVANTGNWPWNVSAAGSNLTWLQGQLNDTWVAGMLYSNNTAVAFNPATGAQINCTPARAGIGGPDELHLDLSLPYVYWVCDGSTQGRPWRLDTDTVVSPWAISLTGGGNLNDDHSTPIRNGLAGWAADGTPYGGAYYTNTTTGERVRFIQGDDGFHGGSADWYNNGYGNIAGFSGAHTDQWFLADMFINDSASWAIRRGTICFVKLTGEVRFLVGSQNPAPSGYFNYTRSHSSPDGKLVFWTSTMNASGQSQVFLCKTPTS